MQVADEIDVHEMTINGWESNATVPEIRHMPVTNRSLGYTLCLWLAPSVSALPQHEGRLASGRKDGPKPTVDPATLMGWEAGRHRPTGRSLDLIGRVLNNP